MSTVNVKDINIASVYRNLHMISSVGDDSVYVMQTNKQTHEDGSNLRNIFIRRQQSCFIILFYTITNPFKHSDSYHPQCPLSHS